MANSNPHRGIPIEAWTQETIDNLSTLHISAATVARPPSAHAPLRGTTVSLDIPLDAEHPAHDALRPSTRPADDGQAVRSNAYARRREPIRRDSLKRREALLKGKEGSRRRQRWENACLLRYDRVTLYIAQESFRVDDAKSYLRRKKGKKHAAFLKEASKPTRRRVKIQIPRRKKTPRSSMLHILTQLLPTCTDLTTHETADRLLGNPYLTPPEPHDWAPQPTHPVHAVPYVLAPLWDERKAQAAYARAERQRELRIAGDDERRVPRELRERLKRSHAARGLLQRLEEPVREFVGAWAAAREEAGGSEMGERVVEEGWMDAGAALRDEDEDVRDVEAEDSDDEIVFVGRSSGLGEARAAAEERSNTAARRKRKGAEDEQLQRDKLVFDGLVDDHGASFGRWLVHSIAAYYNLRTWSVTKGNPARREAYVGIPDGVDLLQPGGRGPQDGHSIPCQLPRPLWVMV